MQAVVYHVDDLKAAAGLPPSCKTVLFGRSMGSIPAIHLACVAPDCFDGLVVESGVAAGVAASSRALEASEKLALLPRDLPVLVIHGDVDHIVPYDNATTFRAARPSARLLTLNAGHNDLLMDPANGQAYFNAVRILVHSAVTGDDMPTDIPHAKGARPANPSPFGSLA